MARGARVPVTEIRSAANFRQSVDCVRIAEPALRGWGDEEGPHHVPLPHGLRLAGSRGGGAGLALGLGRTEGSSAQVVPLVHRRGSGGQLTARRGKGWIGRRQAVRDQIHRPSASE